MKLFVRYRKEITNYDPGRDDDKITALQGNIDILFLLHEGKYFKIRQGVWRICLEEGNNPCAKLYSKAV